MRETPYICNTCHQENCRHCRGVLPVARRALAQDPDKFKGKIANFPAMTQLPCPINDTTSWQTFRGFKFKFCMLCIYLRYLNSKLESSGFIKSYFTNKCVKSYFNKDGAAYILCVIEDCTHRSNSAWDDFPDEAHFRTLIGNWISDIRPTWRYIQSPKSGLKIIQIC